VRNRSPVAALVVVFVVSCNRGGDPSDAGASSKPKARVPAPNSPLAREFGADDAGRGEFRFYDDGPWCGSAVRVDRKQPLGAPLRLDSKALMAPLQSGPIAFFATERPPIDGPREEAQKVMLKLTLAGPKRVVSDEPIALVLSLANGSPNPLVFSVAVDGSFEHWKSPFTDLYALDEGSGRTYRWAYGESFGRCGNVNSRSKDDIVRLAPGATKKAPFGPWSDTALNAAIGRPGRYRLWVVYAECFGPERGSPLGSDDVIPSDVFDGTIASNAIIVEVAAPAPR
jgi:hypothetical protein